MLFLFLAKQRPGDCYWRPRLRLRCCARFLVLTARDGWFARQAPVSAINQRAYMFEHNKNTARGSGDFFTTKARRSRRRQGVEAANSAAFSQTRIPVTWPDAIPNLQPCDDIWPTAERRCDRDRIETPPDFSGGVLADSSSFSGRDNRHDRPCRRNEDQLPARSAGMAAEPPPAAAAQVDHKPAQSNRESGCWSERALGLLFREEHSAPHQSQEYDS
jgi:hypothetical protein